MKHLYIYCLLIFTCLPQVNAQMKKMKDIDAFNKRIVQEAVSVKSIESDFTQIKHLDLFNEDITSKGKFYYKHSDKISLDYNHPTKYLIVINGEKLKIVSDGKKNVVNLKSNKVMTEMRAMLTACMSGNISRISGYSMEYFEDAGSYLIKIKPTNKSIQAYISGFDIYMDKKDMSVSKLRISENATDYTDYLFQNKKFNTLTDDKKFSVN
ncbi:outer membrane lipoprotein carrier protein LolA [Dysgonomonas sp. Marseille-P4677]|uniref:outer membrane lipoprotein carrier protein LolA n=1 Tax=Dysgonomonas sp. Marseille-P4677 TaxID=2364790 RepID=UPI001911FF82|nr:outer membrane lipoprotein carrier protein LolA [Dysgonomonas sp. Marseille-P4677]MBK5720101.1 outer membrane lipoprotein carrier protein LolA [Dysgonomonas sp. Marseille-P4677]